MSKESIEELEKYLRSFIDYRDTEQYARTVSHGVRNGWHAALSYAAKQQAERDAKILNVFDEFDMSVYQHGNSKAVRTELSAFAFDKIRNIMEGKP